MTIAVCVYCGAIKIGALTVCAKCGQGPGEGDDFVYSMVLSDHYFDHETLEGISAQMLAGGPRPSLPQDQLEEMRKAFAAELTKPSWFKKLFGGKKDAKK